jgi:hypothetical protein
MINIEKRPVLKTEMFVHNGSYITKESWEDEIELLAYPFTSTLRIDHVQQSVTITTVWQNLIPIDSAKLEAEIDAKMKKMYVNPE